MKMGLALVGAGLLLAAWTMQPHAASAVEHTGCPALASDSETLGCKEVAAQPLEGVRYAQADLFDVTQRCRSLVADLLGIDPDEISAISSFADDLGADGLDMVELVMAMESEFDIEVPDAVAENMLTFGDMVAIAAQRLAW